MSAQRVAAEIVGTSSAMTQIMERVANNARSLARAHNGRSWSDPSAPRFADSIKVITAGGGLDRLVINTDPLAIPKEFGHILVRNGDQIGYVKGQFSMTRAARMSV